MLPLLLLLEILHIALLLQLLLLLKLPLIFHFLLHHLHLLEVHSPPITNSLHNKQYLIEKAMVMWWRTRITDKLSVVAVSQY